MQEYRLRVQVSGRYLVDTPDGSGPFPVLAAFHGYGQVAEDGMAMLRAVPGSERWLKCSVEALHPFMNMKGDPGASWMTRRDRELRITENVAYVDAVLDQVMAGHPVSGSVVLAGFSQGAGMACRTAVLGSRVVSAVMLLGGDIPPELGRIDRMAMVHIARGERDRLYPPERFDADRERLRNAGLPFASCSYRGGHAPNEEYFADAGRFLSSVG